MNAPLHREGVVLRAGYSEIQHLIPKWRPSGFTDDCHICEQRRHLNAAHQCHLCYLKEQEKGIEKAENNDGDGI